MRSEPNLPARQGHKRVETAGVYPLAPRRGARRIPPLRFSEKRPARSGEPPAHLVPPAQSVQKRTAVRIERTR